MIIKLAIPFTTYARHRQEKVVKPITYKERVKADRLVMVILLLMTIAGAILTS
jgi:hypothetical protein